MKIILSEKISNLGNLGDIVQVKPGYARNYLLPQGKAIRATRENIDIFERERKNLVNSIFSLSELYRSLSTYRNATQAIEAFFLSLSLSLERETERNKASIDCVAFL